MMDIVDFSCKSYHTSLSFINNIFLAEPAVINNTPNWAIFCIIHQFLYGFINPFGWAINVHWA